MNAIDIVKEQAAAYDAGKSFAVVTIVQSDGSTPRSSGKMIVYPDGSSKGTVGGGAVELLAIRDAQNAYSPVKTPSNPTTLHPRHRIPA